MAPATNQKWPKGGIADMIYSLFQNGYITVKISKKIRKHVLGPLHSEMQKGIKKCFSISEWKQKEVWQCQDPQG